MCYFQFFSVKITEDGKTALMQLSQGDMRKVLNVLQSTATAFPEVNEETVYTCVGHPLKSDIRRILQWLLNHDFKTAYNCRLLLLFSMLFIIIYILC